MDKKEIARKISSVALAATLIFGTGKTTALAVDNETSNPIIGVTDTNELSLVDKLQNIVFSDLSERQQIIEIVDMVTGLNNQNAIDSITRMEAFEDIANLLDVNGNRFKNFTASDCDKVFTDTSNTLTDPQKQTAAYLHSLNLVNGGLNNQGKVVLNANANLTIKDSTALFLKLNMDTPVDSETLRQAGFYDSYAEFVLDFGKDYGLLGRNTRLADINKNITKNNFAKMLKSEMSQELAGTYVDRDGSMETSEGCNTLYDLMYYQVPEKVESLDIIPDIIQIDGFDDEMSEDYIEVEKALADGSTETEWIEDFIANGEGKVTVEVENPEVAYIDLEDGSIHSGDAELADPDGDGYATTNAKITIECKDGKIYIDNIEIEIFDIDDEDELDTILKYIDANPDDLTILGLDDMSEDVTVDAIYTDGSFDDITDDCDFKSENEDVAYISEGRIYSGDEEGTVRIKVTYENDGETMVDYINISVVDDEKQADDVDENVQLY